MRSPVDQLEAFIPGLRRFARSLTHSVDQADDLVQDTLVKAIDKIDQFDPETNLRAWLFTILLNTFKSQRRMIGRRGVHVAWGDVADQLSGPPGQQVGLELRALARAIDRLPDHERETLMLVVLEDLSYDDAAAVLGVRAGTVKSRVSRARARLRDFESNTSSIEKGAGPDCRVRPTGQLSMGA